MREKFLQDPKNIVNISVLILYIERFLMLWTKDLYKNYLEDIL